MHAHQEPLGILPFPHGAAEELHVGDEREAQFVLIDGSAAVYGYAAAVAGPGILRPAPAPPGSAILIIMPEAGKGLLKVAVCLFGRCDEERLIRRFPTELRADLTERHEAEREAAPGEKERRIPPGLLREPQHNGKNQRIGRSGGTHVLILQQKLPACERGAHAGNHLRKSLRHSAVCDLLKA